MSDDIYKLAKSLASDLAEEYTAHKINDCMVEGAKEKAKKIRYNSENNINPDSLVVQDYRGDQTCIYGAIYQLLEGYKGYKIIKTR